MSAYGGSIGNLKADAGSEVEARHPLRHRNNDHTGCGSGGDGRPTVPGCSSTSVNSRTIVPGKINVKKQTVINSASTLWSNTEKSSTSSTTMRPTPPYVPAVPKYSR